MCVCVCAYIYIYIYIYIHTVAIPVLLYLVSYMTFDLDVGEAGSIMYTGINRELIR